MVSVIPVAPKPQKPDNDEEEEPTKPSNPSTPSGGGETNKVEDIIKEIVKIEVNGKTTNANGINQEKIVKEVKETIKKSLDDIVVTNLETKLNSSEGAVQIKVSRVLADIGKEIDNIINKNIGNASGAGKAKYEVKLSIIEEASKQKVFEKSGVTATEEGIEVQNLKDFTPYIVKFDIVVDGKVVETREKKIMTLDRTPPVIHDLEVKDGVLKVNATDNYRLNDKPYMLIVAE